MSDAGSDTRETYHLLPTDHLIDYGHTFLSPGIPSEREENLSLLGIPTQYFCDSESDFSDDTSNVAFAKTPLTYGATKTLTDGVTLTWRELSVYVPKKETWWKKQDNYKPFKRVLNNAFGALKPGSLVALMGASGAGKSTLMNALAHRTSKTVVVDGEILVNSFPFCSSMSRISGYVHQDDLFVGTLTVREHLTFMARLRMDSRTAKQERNARVNELLKELGLSKSQNTGIGIPGLEKSISGGERKRLAFASEILTDPPLLFCDEPTTGLDSFNARKVVRMLKDMAARGKTILCTIHQPSSEVFAMFDRLLLLAEGRVAYMGSSAGALEFFESLNHKCPSTFNPADFYIHTLAVLPGHELESRSRIKRICNNYAVSSYAKDLDVVIQRQDSIYIIRRDSKLIVPFDIEPPEKPGWHIQFYWLLWRAVVDSYRNPSIHAIRICQKIMIAIVIGLCYTNVQLNQAGIQNIQGVMFTFVTENTFPSLFGVLNIFPYELPVFLREFKNGIYGVDTYYIAKVVSLIPGFIADPLVFCLTCYWMVGLRKEAYNFAMTVLIIVFTANVSSAFGAMFSAMFESIPYIMLVLIPVDIVLLISGGLFINIDSMSVWVSWVRYLSWFMYSNEALTITQWSGVANISCELPPEMSCISTGEDVIHDYAFKESNLFWDFIFMFVLYVFFHCMGYLGLKLRTKRV